MRRKLTHISSKVSGNPSDTTLSLAFELAPESPEIISTRGSIFGVLEISVTGTTPLSPSVPKDLLEFLENSYFSNMAGSNLQAIKESVKQTVENLRENFKDNSVSVNLSLAVVWGEIIYLIIAGEGRILIRRGGAVFPLLVDDKSEFVQSASGYILNGDNFILGTKSLFALVGEDGIKDVLDKAPVTEVQDLLVPIIHGSEEMGAGAAGLFLSFKEAEVPSEEEKIEFSVPAEAEVQKPEMKYLTFLENISQTLKSKIAGIIEKGESLIGRLIPRKQIYLSSSENTGKNKKIYLVLAGIILVVLAGFLSFQFVRNRNISRVSALDQAITQADKRRDEAVGLKGLNDALARNSLVQAKTDLVNFAVATFGAGWSGSKDPGAVRIQAEVGKINSAIDDLSNVNKITGPNLFYDLSLLKDGATGSNGKLLGSTMTVIDRNTGTVFQVDDKTKAGSIIAGGDGYKSPGLISVYGDSVYILGDQGIYRINNKAGKKDLAISASNQWGNIAAMESFAGNIYLLDSKNGMVWKYIVTDSGFSDLKPYLNPDVHPDFAKAVSFAIDGSVFVLLTNGNLDKFTQGQPDTLNLKASNKPFDSPTQLVTSDSLNNIYIWDNGNTRLVVFDKQGQYLSQYQFDKNFKPASVMVDESQKKAFFLSGSKIYSIDIK